MTKGKTLFLAILLIGLGSALAVAQPTIHGALSGTLGPGAYIVDGNLTVNAGSSLTIASGTTLMFAGHYSFKIYGTLNATGTAADSINFVRQFMTSACEWGGLRFMAGAANGTVSYALFEGGRYQVYPDANGGAIFTAVPVSISHCSILNCYSASGGGIYVANVNTGSVNIADCIVMNCSAGNGGALYLYYSTANITVENCAIARNSSTST